jgi:hypothetical protein
MTDFMVRVVALEDALLSPDCDVISAMTDFMVRGCCTRGCTSLSRL